METPPDYSQYPRPNQFGGIGSGSGRPYRGPGIYFDFLNDAWNMVMKNMGVYVVGTLLVFIITQVVNIPFSLLNNVILGQNPFDPGSRRNSMPNFSYASVPLLMLSSLIPMAVGQVLNAGISLAALEEADTGMTTLNTIFSGFRYFVNVAVTSVLYILAIYIGIIFCFIPGIYIAGAFAFAPIIAAKEGLGPIQSMQRSYEMLKPFAWANFGFLFVASLINIIGIIACCVGMLWTIPIMYIGIALHYREFRGPANQGFVAPTMP